LVVLILKVITVAVKLPLGVATIALVRPTPGGVESGGVKVGLGEGIGLGVTEIVGVAVRMGVEVGVGIKVGEATI
jgi:hypothetical protein